MRRTLLVEFFGLLVLIDPGVALITNWTTPVIPSKSGSGTLKIKEDASTLTTLGTLKASSKYTVSYNLQTWFSPFRLSSKGALSLLHSLDYEEDEYHVIKVKAVDVESTGTATITIEVQDVDEPPQFSSSSFDLCILDGSGAGTIIAVVSATDPEGQDVTHTLRGLTDGNTDGIFTIDSKTGVIKVGDGNTIDKNTTSSYDFNVVASDSSFTVTASVAVTVADECSAAASVAVGLFPIILPILCFLIYFK